MDEIIDMYKHFSKYCLPGVFALINHTDKRLYLASSNNVLASVSKLFYDIKFNKHPLKDLVAERQKLNLILLSKDSNKDIQLHLVRQFAEQYTEQGYTFYQPPRYTTYSWYTKITPTHKVEVYLKSNYGKSHLIVTYDNLRDANKYIKRTSIYKQLQKLSKEE